MQFQLLVNIFGSRRPFLKRIRIHNTVFHLKIKKIEVAISVSAVLSSSTLQPMQHRQTKFYFKQVWGGGRN